MKSKIIVSVAVVSLAVLLISTIPYAFGEDERPERKEKAENERIDRDADGSVTYREFYAKFSEKYDDTTLKRIFEEADVNNDGLISGRELIKARLLLAKVRVKEAVQKIKRPDADGDGYLTLRELNAFMNGKIDEATLKRIFNAADGDNDGKLSRREQAHAMQLIMKYVKTKMVEKKERIRENIDSDRSGEREEKVVKIRRILNNADKDENGKISLREILWVLKMIRRTISA